MEPSTMQFFYDLGLPVVNGYGLTEGGTALTLNDLKPFRADTVGKPLPGVELRILNPDANGIGEVAARSKTLMSHYLDDPDLTLETIPNLPQNRTAHDEMADRGLGCRTRPASSCAGQRVRCCYSRRMQHRGTVHHIERV